MAAPRKCEIVKIKEKRPWGDGMVAWHCTVRWDSTAGPVDDEVEINAKANGRKYEVGQRFDAERTVDDRGRIKVKNVTPAGEGRGPWRGGGGKGGGGYGRRPPAEIPWDKAVELFKRAAKDLGVPIHSEHIAAMMIALFNGDILAPGQKPAAASNPPANPPAQQQRRTTDAQKAVGEVPNDVSRDDPWS